MEAQQLSSKVAALESKVAVLEDEGKILKGEVKQILTEIRTAILVRDNPFDDGPSARQPQPPIQVVPAAPPEPIARVEIIAPAPDPEPAPESRPLYAEAPAPKEPTMLSPEPTPMHAAPPPPAQPQWSLLTIASLTAWGEEAMRRLGSLRFEILLDLCEAAGHISPDARGALSRVKELDVPAPEQAPSTNDTVVILRQLDALLNDEYGEQPLLRIAHR